MMAAPLTRCVTCFEELTLAELAHSPCKHCHVEFCNECLTRAFEIAQRDDVLEVHCPNPHCRKLLNADSMQIKATTIKQWVKEELLQKKYGILNQYEEKNWDSADIVRLIINTRKRDLTHVRRKSSVWEEQLTKLKLRAKADLADVPLAPVLYTNASTDRIDLRSKFTSKMTRSQSVPNVNVADKTIQMFKSFADEEGDDDLETDTDFSDSDDEVTQPKGKRLINAIIDEEQELNDCHYHSPMNSEQFTPRENLSCHSSPYDRNTSPPYISSMLSNKKSSDMTMISISESSHTVTESAVSKGHLSPTLHHNKSNRLSATFRAIFTNKAVSADVVNVTKKQKKNARSRGQSDQNTVRQNRKVMQNHARHSANNRRILDIFSKHKQRKKLEKDKRTRAPREGRKNKRQLQKTASSRALPRHTKSNTLDMENVRSITPDPYPSTEFRRSQSQQHHLNAVRNDTPPVSPPPPQKNQLSLSYQKQLMQLNIKNKKRKHISRSNPPPGELKTPNYLPSIVTPFKSKSAPTATPPPVDNTLSTQKTSKSSNNELSSSELSTSISSAERPGSPEMNKLPELPTLEKRYDIESISGTATGSKVNRKPCLAPISSVKEEEEDDEDRLPIEPSESDDDEIPSKLSKLSGVLNIEDDIVHFDINAHVDETIDQHSESSTQKYSITAEEEEMEVLPATAPIDDNDDDDLDHVPHTFMTETATTNTNTMPVPATPDLSPMCPKHDGDDLDADDDADELPPIRMSLVQDIDDMVLNNMHRKDTSNTDPDTPPTPQSPNSCSMTSNNSHYERMMRNIDSAIARQTETNSTQMSSNNKNNNHHKRHDPPSQNESSGAGCNGCTACCIL